MNINLPSIGSKRRRVEAPSISQYDINLMMEFIKVINKLQLSMYHDIIIDLCISNDLNLKFHSYHDIIDDVLHKYSHVYYDTNNFNNNLCGSDIMQIKMANYVNLIFKYETDTDVVHIHNIKHPHITAKYHKQSNMTQKKLIINNF